MNVHYSKIFFCLWLTALCIVGNTKIQAQCSNWSISAQLTAAASCASNGAFSVTLHGIDVANLSNIQYGIPIAANGFSLPLNTSPNFTSIPPGVYQVSVVANCGSTIVGRNTTITIPGTYVVPTIFRTSTRSSLSCGATGKLSIGVNNGVLPFTYTITSHPIAYAGATSISSNSNYFTFDKLPAGAYAIQVVDACSSGTIPKTDTVLSVNPTTANYIFNGVQSKGCDTLIVNAPLVDENISGWSGYSSDTSFKWSMQISGGIASSTPFVSLGNSSMSIKLPSSQSIKSCYGKTITYTIQPPCGVSKTITSTIPYPVLSSTIKQHCNIDFSAEFSLFYSLVCVPIYYTMTNTATAQSYGPFISNTKTLTTPNLPLGNYTVSFTTGDGYTSTRTISTSNVSGNPYSVRVINGASGLNNYVDGFQFQTSNASIGGNRKVELFSGPAGYSFQDYWYGGSQYFFDRNGFPTPSSVKFPPGNYVWKITDDCGIYYLNVSVSNSDLYQFTVGTPAQRLTCQGLWITPTGTASSAGSSQPLGFSLLLNGRRMITVISGAFVWPVYPLGTPILLTQPGIYTIVPTSTSTANFIAHVYNPGGFALGYPNIYTSSYTFSYTQKPLGIDVNQTQGFLCNGAIAGTAQVAVKGQDGTPFYTPKIHYHYSLALAGNGVSGPFIATNDSGFFSGFSGNAGAFYDVKVEDTCGAFVVQRIKILDLNNSRLISSSSYVACAGTDVLLSAIFLPNATYSWTGPNGFSSSLRQPTITNVNGSKIGIYRVLITTPKCGTPVADSTTLTMNPNPPKPIISYQCSPEPITLSITNPGSGILYQWDYGYPYLDFSGIVYSHGVLEPSDTLFTKYIYNAGSYTAVATDTLTGCTTKSDSLVFNTDPTDTLRASIYAPHLQLCTGDTTTLVAGGYGSALNMKFQWLRNGNLIIGATSGNLVVSTAGSYQVILDGGPCKMDTSAIVIVSIISPPTASISASSLSICAGDTSVLQTNTGTGFSYTWQQNGSTIPNAFSSVYKATSAGVYNVIISNGACVAIASPITLTVNPAPVVNISPSGIQTICTGTSLALSTSSNAGWTYSWLRNGLGISGATNNTYTTSSAGIYQVKVSTAICPSILSNSVIVKVLVTSLDLGADTTFCNDSVFLPLSVDSNFSQILWSTGAATPNIIATKAGTYWVRAINQCGTFSDTMRIHDAAEFLLNFPDDTLICNSSSSARFSVSAFLQNILWSTGATSSSISIDTPGIYWVEGESPCGMVRDTMKVRFCAPVISKIAPSKDSICEGDCLEISAKLVNFPKTFNWTFAGGNPGSSTLIDPGIVCYSTAGIYPIRLIIRNNGGADTAESFVVVSTKPDPRFKDTIITVPYKSLLELPACATAQITDWYLNDSLVCANCPSLKLEPKNYQSVYRCVLRNGDCTDSCSYALTVVDIPNDLWLPNAFTPNGDSRNDVFHVITDNPNIRIIGLIIYNRWGQQVFVSNQNTQGWNGKLHNQDAEAGTYFWQLQYKVLGNKDKLYFKKGDVLLVR